MIRKRKKGYYVVSHDGRNLGGPYKTRQGASQRLAEVEMFKQMKKRRAKK